MRFIALLSMALVAVSAQYCDPSKWNVTFYNDTKCQNYNWRETQMNGRTKKEHYQAYSGNCEVSQPGMKWQKIKCFKDSIQVWNFMDDDCQKPTQKDSYMYMKWDECIYQPSITPMAFKINTWQQEFDRVPASMNMNNMSPAMKFDRYFFYAIDHQGKEPGSMMPACSSSRDCMGNHGMDGDKKDDMGGRMKTDFCCTHAEVHDMKNNKKHELYRCMNEKVVHQNENMMMEDIRMELKCVDGGHRSAASSIIVAAISAISLAAANMI